VADALITHTPDRRTVTTSRSLYYVNDVFDIKVGC